MAHIRSYDGTEIFYQVHGHGPTPLLLLHGLGGGAGGLWEGVAPHLDLKRFRAICPDFRGQGRSGQPTGGYSWDGFSRDMLAVVDDAQADQFITVGFSFGGKLACYLAAKQAGRIPRQILVAPVAPGFMPMDREAVLQLCRDAVDWRRIRPFFRNFWFGTDVDEPLLDACCQSIAQIPTAVLEASVEMALWNSLVDAIGHLAAPTLVVVGNQDPIYHADYQREQTFPILRQAGMVSLDCGHFIPRQRPAELAALIAAFAAQR